MALAPNSDTEADPYIHANVFHHPANQEQTRPYLGPAVTEAQWYTLDEEGMAEASSARPAPIQK